MTTHRSEHLSTCLVTHAICTLHHVPIIKLLKFNEYLNRASQYCTHQSHHEPVEESVNTTKIITLILHLRKESAARHKRDEESIVLLHHLQE